MRCYVCAYNRSILFLHSIILVESSHNAKLNAFFWASDNFQCHCLTST